MKFAACAFSLISGDSTAYLWMRGTRSIFNIFSKFQRDNAQSRLNFIKSISLFWFEDLFAKRASTPYPTFCFRFSVLSCFLWYLTFVYPNQWLVFVFCADVIDVCGSYFSVYYLNFLRDDARYCSVKLSFKELLMVAFNNKERGEGG